MNTNYRSDIMVVNSSRKLIVANNNRINKNLKCDSTKYGVVTLIKYKTRRIAYERIAADIIKKRDEGANLLDIAVLFRTHSLEREFEAILKEMNIPCNNLKGQSKKYNDIKIILDYLELLDKGFSYERIRHIMNTPSRGISSIYIDINDVSFESWLEKIKRCGDKDEYRKVNEFKEEVEFLSRLSISNFIRYMINRYIVGIEESIAIELLKLSEESTSYEMFRNKILGIKDKKEDYGVNVMTMHQSKGLEFDSVYIPDLNKGIMPMKKAVLPHEEEEERRLLYVAMTRAKHNLILSYVTDVNNKSVVPSPFIEEIVKIKP